jgi:hypothetical protein
MSGVAVAGVAWDQSLTLVQQHTHSDATAGTTLLLTTVQIEVRICTGCDCRQQNTLVLKRSW